MLKRSLCFILLNLFLISGSLHAENWKGNTVTTPLELGAMAGANLYGSSLGWSLLGTAAYLAVPKGWLDDIDERVWAEIQMGPAFFSHESVSQTGLQYSGHLRWDFTMNQDWTFYALGGLGGYYLPTMLGGCMTVHPRFGMGAEFQTKLAMMFRMEVSAEFMGVGVAFNF